MKVHKQSERRPDAHRWKVLATGVTANVAFSAGLSGLPATAVYMRADYGLDTAGLGLILGIMGLGLAISELPWGVAADRWGDRPVLLIGVGSVAAFFLWMMGFAVPDADHLPVVALSIGLVAVGLFGGSVNGASGRAIMAWFATHERGLAMSIRQTAVPLGGGMGALGLPWIASHYGFAGIFGALAAGCAFSFVMTACWLRDPPQRVSGLLGAPSRAAWKDSGLWRTAGAIGILCLSQFAVINFTVLFLHDYAGLEIMWSAMTLAAIHLMAGAARIWSGYLTDRRGNRRGFWRRCVYLAFGAFLILAFASWVWPGSRAIALPMLIAGVLISTWHGVAYIEIASAAGTRRAGTALGMANTCVYMSLFIAPLGIGRLQEGLTWPAIWTIVALTTLLAIPLMPRTQRVAAPVMPSSNNPGDCRSPSGTR
ncbi:MFS transporter [Pseudomonas sp. Marseille-QA0892]